MRGRWAVPEITGLILTLSSRKYFAIAVTSLVIFTVSNFIPVSGQIEGLYVSEPVTPFIVDANMMSTFAATSAWQPGDPIKERDWAPPQVGFQSLTESQDVIPVPQQLQSQLLAPTDDVAILVYTTDLKLLNIRKGNGNGK